MNYSGAQAMHLQLSAGRFQLLETVYSVSEGLEMETDVCMRSHFAGWLDARYCS